LPRPVRPGGTNILQVRNCGNRTDPPL